MICESQMTLGLDYEGGNVTGWYASEKLDGCRAYWDGQTLWTRGGNVIPAPAWFTSALPAGFRLDGEIYCGRNTLEEARCAVQYGHFTPRCRFVAFDAPGVVGTWLERIAAAAGNVETVSPWTVESRRQLRCRLRDVLEADGEGIMLRNPSITRYECGRTSNLLKFKSSLHL